MTEQKINELISEEKRRYAREWRAKNKDRVRETNRRYWEKRALEHMKKEQRTVPEVV